jgi:hydroxymethylpyrimidine pyrophosphatase-like HAD family hydrolase
MSKKMGMNYLTPKMREYYRQRQIACIVHENGHILSMPRYYKQQIFTKKELKKINDEYQKLNAHKFDIQTQEEFRTDLESKKMLIYKNEKQLKLQRQKL